MATDSTLFLLLSMVSFLFKCVMLLCISPLIGSGPLQAVIKEAFHTLTRSPNEFEYPSEYDGDEYIEESPSDDWEACRCLGIIAIVFLSAATFWFIFSVFTRWLHEHPLRNSKPYGATQLLPDTAHAHGTHRSRDTHNYCSPSTHDSSSPSLLNGPQTEPQTGSSFLVKPFPCKNFDPFYGRDRPLRQLEPIFPIPTTDRRTFLQKDMEREGGNEYVDMYGSLRWQRIPQIEADDTSVADAVAADILQLLPQPEEDTSMADLSAVAVLGSPELPPSLLTAAPEPQKSAEASKHHRSFSVYNDGSIEQAPRATQGTLSFTALGSGVPQTFLTAATGPAESTETSNLPCGPSVYNEGLLEPAPHATQSVSPFKSLGYEALRATPTATAPSPEQLLQETLRLLDSESEALSEALNCFRKAILAWDSDTYQEPADNIKAWLGRAEEKLTAFAPLNVRAQEVHQWIWIQILSSFYNELQPYGYLFEEHGDEALESLLNKIYCFGRHLGLQLQTPNFTRPGTPPTVPQQQPTAFSNTIGGDQAAISAVPAPPVQTQDLPAVSQQRPSAFWTTTENLQPSMSAAAQPISFDFGAPKLNFGITKEEFTPARRRQTTARRSHAPRPRVTRTSPTGAVSRPSPSGSPSRRPCQGSNHEPTFEEILEDQMIAEFNAQ